MEWSRNRPEIIKPEELTIKKQFSYEVSRQLRLEVGA